MIKIEFIILTSICLAFNCQEYQTFHFKDSMKVQSFAFSQNGEYMVVNQRSSYARGTQSNLPHYIYKKGVNGYKIVGKESYERVVPQGNWNQNFYGVGKIQISSKGNIFVSLDVDSVVRIFEIRQGMTHEIQTIIPKQDEGIQTFFTKKDISVSNFFLSYDGNYIFTIKKQNYLIVSMLIYKWNTTQFIQYGEIKSGSFSMDTLIGAQGQIIISSSSSTIYKHIENNNYELQQNFTYPKKIAGQVSSYQLCQLAKEANGVYTLLTACFFNKQGKASLELRYLQLNLNNLSITYKQDFSTDVGQTYYLLTYLTKNGQFFAYANKKGQYVMLYGKKNGKFQLIYKFWNFTQGPSDIYVSQDGTLVAVANQFIARNDQIFNKDGQQIAFFYKCGVDNCQKCSWNKICSQCKEDYVKKGAECINLNNLSVPESVISQNKKQQQLQLQLQPSREQQIKDYQSQLQKRIIIFAIALIIAFIIICLAFHCFKRIFNYFGYYFEFGMRKKMNQLNEQKVMEIGSSLNSFKKQQKQQVDKELE